MVGGASHGTSQFRERRATQTGSRGRASKILHVHPNTLRKRSDVGLIPGYRAGRRRDRRFSAADLVDFLERNGNVAEAQRRAAGQLDDL